MPFGPELGASFAPLWRAAPAVQRYLLEACRRDVEVGEFALRRASRDASSGPFSPGRKCAFWIAEPELRRSVQVFSFQEDSERDAPELAGCKKTQPCTTTTTMMMMGNSC